MTWPEVIYRIIIEGGGGLLTATIILALFTDFWPTVFRRDIPVRTKIKYVGVSTEAAAADLRSLAAEIRGFVAAGNVARPYDAICWAARIERIVPEDKEEEDEEEEYDA